MESKFSGFVKRLLFVFFFNSVKESSQVRDGMGKGGQVHLGCMCLGVTACVLSTFHRFRSFDRSVHPPVVPAGSLLAGRREKVVRPPIDASLLPSSHFSLASARRLAVRASRRIFIHNLTVTTTLVW